MSNLKKCAKCGTANILSAKFCRGCGGRLDAADFGKAFSGTGNSKGSKILTIAILIAAVIIIAMVGIIVFFKYDDIRNLINGNNDSSKAIVSGLLDESEDDYEDEDESLNDEDDEAKSESDGEGSDDETGIGKKDDDAKKKENVDETVKEETVSVEVTDDDRRFNISPDQVTDYESALHPENYEYYSSGKKDFGFWYSTELYNDVVFDETERNHDYGTLIQSIDFSGTDGTKLVFRLYKRTDKLSVEKATEFVHSTETGALEQPEELLNTVKDGHGKVIVTGKDGTNADDCQLSGSYR